MVVLNIEGMDPSARSESRWKISSLRDLVLQKSEHNFFIPFISITETWLKPYIHDAHVSIQDYNIFRSDRRVRTRGGALLYIHQSIPVINSDTYDDCVCEAVICTSARKNIIASIYRPPKASTQSFCDAIDFIEAFINKECSGNPEHYQIIITGDFNFPDVSWDDLSAASCPSESRASAECLLGFMSRLLLAQYVNVPTREGNILDLLLTNDPNLVHHVSSEDTTMSDHNCMHIISPEFLPSSNVRSCLEENTKSDEINFNKLNYQKADFTKINQALSEVSWDNIKESCTLEEFPLLLNKKLFEICAKHTPLWVNKKAAKKDQRCRRSLNRKKYKLRSRMHAIKAINPGSDKIKVLEEKIKEIQQKVKSSVLLQIRVDEQNALKAIKSNPKAFYKYAKKFRKSKSLIKLLSKKDGSVTTDMKEIADLFQHQFTSVFSDTSAPSKVVPESCHTNLKFTDINFTTEDTLSAIDEINPNSSCGDVHIPAVVLKNCKYMLCYPLKLLWQDSLMQGHVPSFYKEQTIAPVFKKGSKALAENYRPISLTSHVIKTFERIVRKKLVHFLEENNLICNNQHGFRSGKSCLSQLLIHIDTILTNGLEGLETDVIYLDFAKAFDKVDHEVLIKKLSNFGIRGSALNWITDFLSNRYQTVHVNGKKSFRALVKSGVPQGTVLGPILFLLFINDMNKCLKHSTCSMFADDSRILRSISYVSDTHLLQEDVLNVTTWAKENNMELHENKFQFVSHKLKSTLLDSLPFAKEFLQYTTAEGQVLEPLDDVLDLGIQVSSDLSWTKHIGSMANKARQSLSWALSVFYDRSVNTMMVLYKNYVRSKLEYCCPLWQNRKISDIQMIESIQRTFTQRINGMERLKYLQRLEKLHLLSLQRRRERFIIFYMWKIIYGKYTNDLGFQFRFSERRGLSVLIRPLTNTNCKAQTLYDNSFAVLAAKLWNLLPANLSLMSCFSTFKAGVDQFLSQFPDKPPVQGYPYVTDNSLLSF